MSTDPEDPGDEAACEECGEPGGFLCFYCSLMFCSDCIDAHGEGECERLADLEERQRADPDAGDPRMEAAYEALDHRVDDLKEREADRKNKP